MLLILVKETFASKIFTRAKNKFLNGDTSKLNTLITKTVSDKDSLLYRL